MLAEEDKATSKAATLETHGSAPTGEQSLSKRQRKKRRYQQYKQSKARVSGSAAVWAFT